LGVRLLRARKEAQDRVEEDLVGLDVVEDVAGQDGEWPCAYKEAGGQICCPVERVHRHPPGRFGVLEPEALKIGRGRDRNDVFEVCGANSCRGIEDGAKLRDETAACAELHNLMAVHPEHISMVQETVREDKRTVPKVCAEREVGLL
jgi:hypothetical protein